MPKDFGEAVFLKSTIEKEGIMKLSAEKNATHEEARAKLHTFWAERPAEYKPWTISATGDYFDYTV